MTPEDTARLFHETYERLAPEFGYQTRKDSAVGWDQVPEPNRMLMIAVAAVVLDELHAQIRELQREAAGRRRRIANLERTVAALRGEVGPDPLGGLVHEIGAYWRAKCRHSRAKIDPKRYRAVRGRLIGYEGDELRQRVAYIKRAIDGAAEAPNRNEQTGEAYDDLELICRDETKLDSFAKRAPRADAGGLERKLIGT